MTTAGSVAAALAAAVASEAAGVTNVTPIGADAAPEMPQLPRSAGTQVDLSGVFDGLELPQQQSSGENAGAALAAAIQEMGATQRAALANAQQQASERAQNARAQAAAAAGAGGGSGGGSSSGDGFDLQDMAGTGPLGDTVAVLGESGVAVGETFRDLANAGSEVVDVSNTAGRTIGEAGRLIATGRGNTTGTFAEDRGEVMFDYSGDGRPGGRLTDRLPEVPFL